MIDAIHLQDAINAITLREVLLVILLLCIVYVIVQLIRSLRVERLTEQRPNDTMEPVLLATLKGDTINGLSGKTPEGHYFTYVLSGLSLFSDAPTLGMYAVELPYKSGAHLLGLPKDTSTTIGQISNKMEPVTLEGDYPNYFDLYADYGMQTHSRYVLDPAAMLFTVDFCKQYQWEILDDTLYFISVGIMPALSKVDEFIAQIRPAIEVPSDRRKNPYKMSYVGTSIRTMNCPLCAEQLIAHKRWMECPQGHGYLVTGSQLTSLRQSDKGASLSANDISRLRPQLPKQLVCPYCLNQMYASKYSFTPVIIDICSRCMYRWVDSDETSIVFGEDPTFT